MKKRNLKWILLLIILVPSTSLISLLSGEATTTLAASTIRDLTLIPSETFRVNVTVTNVQKLAGYQFILSFTPSILNALDAGSYPPFNTQIVSEINNTAGYVSLAYWTFFGDPNGTSTTDSKPIAWIEFTINDYGTSTLSLSSTGLSDVVGIEISHTLVNGLFRNVLADNAVTNVEVFPTTVNKSEPVKINATVENQGGSTEIFNVTAYYDNVPIETKAVTDLENGTSTTLQFTWDTTYITPNTYTIKVEAEILPDETDTLDNVFIYGNVTIVKPSETPIANFTYSPEQPLEGKSVTFNASFSTPDGGNITSYLWSFGDGTEALYVEANLTDTATHNYTSAGTYTVTLNITDSKGKSDATQTIISIYRHDVAIVNVALEKTEVKAGENLKINVTVANQGNLIETFNVTVSYNDTEIQTKTVHNLAESNSTTLTYNWNTTNTSEGTYIISAEAIVAQDANPIDNNGTGGTITIIGEPQATVSPDAVLVAVATAIIITAIVGIYTVLRKTKTE